MRKITVLAVAMTLSCVSLRTTAQSNTAELFQPSPVGIVLTLGQWLLKDRKQIYFIRVQGEGYSYEAAKQQGLATAVDQAVGAVILREIEVRDSQVVRNDLIKYSSGFVDDYRVTKKQTIGNVYRLELEVWVSSSKIADRLLAGSKHNGRIDGERHAAQLESINQSTVAGGRQLQVILNDFPRRSFVTKAGKSNVLINPDRSFLLTVDYVVHWDHQYLEALSQGLQNLGPKKPDCGVHSNRQITPLESNKIMVRIKRDPTGWGLVNHNCYHFDDDNWYKQVENKLGQRLYLLGKFHSQDNIILYQGCFDVNLSGMNAIGFNLLDIKGNEFWEGRIGIPINATTARYFHNVSLEIVTDSKLCKTMSNF